MKISDSDYKKLCRILELVDELIKTRNSFAADVGDAYAKYYRGEHLMHCFEIDMMREINMMLTNAGQPLCSASSKIKKFLDRIPSHRRANGN